MVLKLCKSRIKLFGLNYPEKWCQPLSQDRGCGFPAAAAAPWSAVSGSASPRRACGERSPLGGPAPAPGTGAARGICTSLKAFQYDLKPNVPKTEGRKMFFDTHAVVRILEENDFTTRQSEVLVNVLVSTTNSNMEVIYSDMVTKVQQEIMLQQIMSKIASVKKDMIILEKSEFSTLLAENEKLKIQLLEVKVQIADVMNKVRSDNILDMNLEKSRVKEMKAQHDKKLLQARTEIMEMTAEQDRHLTQTNMKIDTEVAGLKTMLESHKLDTIKYLAGSVFTCLTVVLGFYRIWM
ncbi:mitochondrial calcium uniporter regulator 1 [Cololabis saira]|uniref:mitochondrial calcium uniporter regulator 1 n=1 Tax=Cololabis saira TaxID=129043 RepID=UPI002AD4EE22|nr:mitochondrial calcium uniporter regulator 1 [Cololabis saira]